MAVLTSSTKSEGPADFEAAALAERAAPAGAKMPRKPAPNVAELSARLFAAYTIEGGSVRLAGCTLEPVTIVHVKARSSRATEAELAAKSATVNVVRMDASCTAVASSEEPVELYLDGSGEMLDAATTLALGMGDLVTIDKPPRLAREEHERLLEMARQYAGRLDDLQVEIIWCRFAAGKLRFTIGSQFVELPFADWAVRLAPPAYVCQHSGRATFHLAAIDDGRVVAAEEIAVCEQIGRRVLRSELVTCSVTGKHVWGELTEACPATGQHNLRARMVDCPICGTRVSPQAIEKSRCRLCADLVALGSDDPRLAQILKDHPRLAGWQR